MINAEMRLYNYFIYGEEDGYGMPALSEGVKGQIKMAIALTSQSVQDNINYRDAQYIGLTHDADITDKYVVKYGSEKLKVLYINPKGRYKQVFMAVM
jgi:hypothetical protein